MDFFLFLKQTSNKGLTKIHQTSTTLSKGMTTQKVKVLCIGVYKREGPTLVSCTITCGGTSLAVVIEKVNSL